MPPKKNLTKKSLLFFKKTLIKRAINSIVIQCKVNNSLLKCGKTCPYKMDEKRATTSKSSKF